jgi:hypothetical protein
MLACHCEQLRVRRRCGHCVAELACCRSWGEARRARALFEIAVAQAERDPKAAQQTVKEADAIADQIAAASPIALWVDTALALVAIEAYARVGDASRAVLMSGKTANRGYRAFAFARIACALSNLRHPFLFFANRPAQL